MAEMTKAELKRSHDAMAKFLAELCRKSDVEWDCDRLPETEKHYQKARRLLKRAGAPYTPPKP